MVEQVIMKKRLHTNLTQDGEDSLRYSELVALNMSTKKERKPPSELVVFLLKMCIFKTTNIWSPDTWLRVSGAKTPALSKFPRLFNTQPGLRITP